MSDSAAMGRSASPQLRPQPVESTDRQNVRAAELRSCDLLPACPRCGDLCDPEDAFCPSCWLPAGYRARLRA